MTERPKRAARSKGAGRPRAPGGGGRQTARRAGSGEGGKSVVEHTRGVFMISVAAELAEMHPQTLRMYEARGLIEPKRSAKNTRLYSHQDVERLRRIQEMTAERGLNLAGVEHVLELEERLERMTEELRRLRARAAQLEERMKATLERASSLRAEIVPYGAYEPDLGSDDEPGRVKIPIEPSPKDSGDGEAPR